MEATIVGVGHRTESFVDDKWNTFFISSSRSPFHLSFQNNRMMLFRKDVSVELYCHVQFVGTEEQYGSQSVKTAFQLSGIHAIYSPPHFVDLKQRR